VKLFTKDPLDAARDSLVKLTERLAIAESVVIEKKESTKRLAVDGADDAALDKAEAAVRVARDRVETLTVAIREVETIISVLEAEQAAAADQKVRAATVVELEAIERDLTKAANDFVSAASRLSAVATKMGTFMADAVGLSIFAASAGSEVPPNVVMLKTLLKGHVSAVLSGHGRATLPQPAAQAALPAPPPAPVQVQPATRPRDVVMRSDPRDARPLQHVAARADFEIVNRGKPYVVSTPAGNAQPGQPDGGDDES
jgi:hypothetical protein